MRFNVTYIRTYIFIRMSFQVTSVGQAKLAKVVPTRNNGSPDIVTLHHDKVRSAYSHMPFQRTDLPCLVLTPFVFHLTDEGAGNRCPTHVVCLSEAALCVPSHSGDVCSCAVPRGLHLPGVPQSQGTGNGK